MHITHKLSALAIILTAAILFDTAMAVSAVWISGGQGHSVLGQGDGSVFTWGANGDGQLGQGDTQMRLLPEPVPLPRHVVAVSAGANHTLFLCEDGTVWACGENTYGQLGDGTSGISAGKQLPVQVKSLADVVAISAGYEFSVALTADGTVYAWGRNHLGQLGNGTTEDSSVPVRVPELPPMQAIAAGGYHVLGITQEGVLCGWGSSQYYQLAQDKAVVPPWRIELPAEAGEVVAIAAGAYHSLALTSDGCVWTWGRNNYGQLGRSGSEQTPAAVNITNVEQIAAGSYHSLALKNDGSVWAWGRNYECQLGCDSPNMSTSPIQVLDLPTVTAIASGNYHSMALDHESYLYAWGLNDAGQLGDGTQGGFGPVKVQVPVTEIQLSQSQVALSVGASTTIDAIVIPESAANRELLWQSMNSEIATASATGVVTGSAVGVTEIVVSSHDGTITASCTVKVGSMVSGHIIAENRPNNSGIEITLLNSSGEVAAQAITGESGEFSLSVPQSDTYTITASLPGWLCVQQPVNVVAGEDTDLGVLPLYRGDINADGVIDRSDLELLATALGSQPGDTSWNPLADVDNSGVVTVLDLLQIVPNVGRE